MATQSQWDSIPDVEEQTPLENGPIKIRWSKDSRDRARVRRGLVAALEDGYMERAVAVPVMTRQKTQIVIKTEEELEAFRKEFEFKGAPRRTRKRIEDEIEKQLKGDDDDEPERSEAYKRRKEETDMDALLNDIVIPHARKHAEETWPGGTVDVDEIDWFWNPQLTSCAGRAYWGSSVPKTYADSPPAIGLAPGYYYKHGLDELLKVVRHELIHVWQRNHENGFDRGGHGQDFKQWLDDMDCDRYCKHW